MGVFQKLFGKIIKAENNFELVPENSREKIIEASIAYNEYGAYCVPLSSQHRTLCQKILKGEVFEPDTIKYVMDNAGDGDIIHAGACFGDFLPALSRSVKKGRHVWAFEPNSENYRCAQITLTLNGINNVHLIKAGLGALNEFEKLVVKDRKGIGLGGSSQIVDTVENGKVFEEVEIVSLDSIVPQDREISILQLDVEGYEQQALVGALETIKRCRPILILEDDQRITRNKWFRDNIMSMGYEVSGKLHYNALILPVN